MGRRGGREVETAVGGGLPQRVAERASVGLEQRLLVMNIVLAGHCTPPPSLRVGRTLMKFDDQDEQSAGAPLVGALARCPGKAPTRGASTLVLPVLIVKNH